MKLYELDKRRKIMIEVSNTRTKAKVFQTEPSTKLIEDLHKVLLDEDIEGEKIRVMPDGHPGYKVPIGFTATLENGKIDPEKIGGDISCGVTVYKLGKMDVDVVDLDTFIENEIPYGRNIHSEQKLNKDVVSLVKFIYKSIERDDITIPINSLGTLGGGNHFISLSRDEDEVVYLTIHSGSRALGQSVLKYWRNKIKKGMTMDYRNGKETLIEDLKSQGREQEIEAQLKSFKQPPNYIEGLDSTKYYRTILETTRYASINRNMIAAKIMRYLDINPEEPEVIESVHNYIGSDGILRKGAISAYENQKVVIPINIRDGIILATGKSNEEWNYSAPHGAGRNFSRTEAKEVLNEADAQKELLDLGIYAPNQPLDEMAGAYRTLDEILPLLEPTVTVDKVIKPFYNFQT